MFPNFPLFPKQASTLAGQVDALYFFLIAVTAFFSVLIALGVIVFAVKFRRRHPDEIGHPIHGSLILELTWTLIPLAIAMVIFVSRHGGRPERSPPSLPRFLPRSL